MRHLGGRAGRGRRKIASFELNGFEPAELCIERASRSRRAAADYANIEGLPVDLLQRFRALLHSVT
jgi:hypothetical protein